MCNVDGVECEVTKIPEFWSNHTTLKTSISVKGLTTLILTVAFCAGNDLHKPLMPYVDSPRE